MMLMRGKHQIRASATLQSLTATSSAEAEYYAMAKGAAYALGTQSYLRDMGRIIQVELHTDSSSARSFSMRRGLGKMRHIQTRWLWLQERVAHKHLKIFKVPGEDNPADIMTKSLTAKVMDRHVRRIGADKITA